MSLKSKQVMTVKARTVSDGAGQIGIECILSAKQLVPAKNEAPVHDGVGPPPLPAWGRDEGNPRDVTPADHADAGSCWCGAKAAPGNGCIGQTIKKSSGLGSTRGIVTFNVPRVIGNDSGSYFVEYELLVSGASHNVTWDMVEATGFSWAADLGDLEAVADPFRKYKVQLARDASIEEVGDFEYFSVTGVEDDVKAELRNWLQREGKRQDGVFRIDAWSVSLPAEGDPLHHLVVRAPDQLCWETLSAVKFTNPTRAWLTYETFFNHSKFHKSNQKHQTGNYLIPLDNVRIFVCQHTPEPVLRKLVDAFLPDLTPEDVVARSALDCPWQPRPEGTVPVGGATPTKLPGAKDTVKLKTGLSVAMPFNFADAGGDSGIYAIGGKNQAAHGAKLKKLESTWEMWKTASRSCVVKLRRVKEGDKWPAEKTTEWNFGGGEAKTDFRAVAKGTDFFKLSDDSAKDCFSVKTGVNYVGSTDQTRVGSKVHLEDNCIDACLRSDLVALQDARVNHSQESDPHLVVLKEWLSITEAHPNDARKLGDGMQVRDLSVLDRGTTKHYICPISIAYLDLDMTEQQPRYAHINDPEWVDYWRDTYAVPLGRAKALLLIRYGLQMGSPNAQNYLLEMQPGEGGKLVGTGKIIVRDLGDAQLHREVIWALHGPEGEPAPVGGHPYRPENAKAFHIDILAPEMRPKVVEVCKALQTFHRQHKSPTQRRLAERLGELQEIIAEKVGRNKLLKAVIPEIRKLKGDYPLPGAINGDVVKQAIRNSGVDVSTYVKTEEEDKAVTGDLESAQKTIAAKITSAPIQYEFGILREIKSYVMETGACDPGREYGIYGGVQLRWSLFSALTRGRNVAGGSAMTDEGVRDPGWQKVLRANAIWGQAHNQAFIETIQSCLGLKFGIDLKSQPDPDRYVDLEHTEEGFRTAGDYWEDEVAWEYEASYMIQRILGDKAQGAPALRAYRDRGWKAL